MKSMKPRRGRRASMAKAGGSAPKKFQSLASRIGNTLKRRTGRGRTRGR